MAKVTMYYCGEGPYTCTAEYFPVSPTANPQRVYTVYCDGDRYSYQDDTQIDVSFNLEKDSELWKKFASGDITSIITE